MKRQITGICVVTLVLGGCLMFAMTKADLTEVIAGKLEIEGAAKSFDVFVRGSPLSGTVEVMEGEVGGPGKRAGLGVYGGVVVQIPIPDESGAIEFLHRWLRTNSEEFSPRNSELVIVGADGSEITRFVLEASWPSRITEPRVTRVGFRGLVVAECLLQADRVTIKRDRAEPR